jgi:hypothetical protein
MVFMRYFWQGTHQIYGHIRCIYTVLANPIYGAYTRLWPTLMRHDTPYVYSAAHKPTHKQGTHAQRLGSGQP